MDHTRTHSIYVLDLPADIVNEKIRFQINLGSTRFFKVAKCESAHGPVVVKVFVMGVIEGVARVVVTGIAIGCSMSNIGVVIVSLYSFIQMSVIGWAYLLLPGLYASSQLTK